MAPEKSLWPPGSAKGLQDPPTTAGERAKATAQKFFLPEQSIMFILALKSLCDLVCSPVHTSLTAPALSQTTGLA